MKRLKQLLADLPVLELTGLADPEVVGVHSDSRRVRKGDVYVAIRGEKADGHQFIGEAVGAGASVIICEEMVGSFPSVTQVRVADTAWMLAQLAHRFHGRPSESLCTIGITGTNGKTTTSYIIASILEAAGMPTGVIGTLAYRIGNRTLPAPNTTPAAPELQELLGQMLHAGMKAVVMEVSSHSLIQKRVAGIAWDAAVFTNLTQDHLDYHKTMEAYFEAKKILFQQLGIGSKKASAILNADDAYSDKLRKSLRPEVAVVTYGIHSPADVRAEDVQESIKGCRFKLVARGASQSIETPLCGAHNILNCLAAAATAVAMGLDLSAVKKGIGAVKNVPGRLERISTSEAVEDFGVFVDYAHTDDALRNVLRTLRPLTKGRLITVFGCGGNRDTTKRPLMGKAAAELSDYSVVTTDNARFEEPAAIAAQVVAGFGSSKNFQVVLDRRVAIQTAMGMAKTGDVVLLAGKGHETYQEIGGTRSAFDDRQVAREVLEQLLSQTPGGVK